MLEDVSKFVRVKRAEINLTQEEFAKEVGVSLRSVSKLEGKVNVKDETVNKVADALGYTPVRKVYFLNKELSTDEDGDIILSLTDKLTILNTMLDEMLSKLPSEDVERVKKKFESFTDELATVNQ